MKALDQPSDWNLLLVADSSDCPERVLRFLAGAVSACGGWVLSRTIQGEECAEIDFEFPRANCVEMYSILVAAGMALSQEAHLQLTGLCQCTMYLLETRAQEIVRLQLTVFTHSDTAWASEEADTASREAA
ncbi:MAG TPA: hypothetical protein VGD62_04460 [Acidobacteriaceae bacterium]